MKENIQQVTLPNGQTADMLVANLNEGQKLSVISTSVLQFLIALLPKASLWDIKVAFRKKMEKAETIEAFTTLLQEELEFHLSVNLIKDHFTVKEEAGKPEVVAEVYPQAE